MRVIRKVDRPERSQLPKKEAEMLNDGASIGSVLHTLIEIEFFWKNGQHGLHKRENFAENLWTAISQDNLYMKQRNNRHSFQNINRKVKNFIPMNALRRCIDAQKESVVNPMDIVKSWELPPNPFHPVRCFSHPHKTIVPINPGRIFDSNGLFNKLKNACAKCMIRIRKEVKVEERIKYPPDCLAIFWIVQELNYDE